MAYGPRKLHTTFTASALTHFGGIYLFHRFIQQVGLRRFLCRQITLQQRNNRYTLTELLLALIYPMILGLEKIEVSAFLKTNGVFQYLTGLSHFPNPATLRRFLTRTAPLLLPRFSNIHNELRAYFLSLPRAPSSFWFDCDSTVQTLYGNQEGALRGYNPDYPGKKSYHPLVVTEAHLKDCLGGFLRPGNVHTAEGIKELMRTIFSLLPHRNRLRFRADAGFYDGNFISLLKENQAQFAIVARLTSLFQLRIGGLRYHRISPIFSAAEFRYQPHGWKRKERFVVLRRKLPKEPTDFQTTLFTLDRYAYSVIVTNLPLEPYNVFQFYQDRSAQERIVRTLKEDYPFGKAPTNSFAANALYAELSLFAYNLVTWFKRLCLPEDWQPCTLPTIRHRLLMMPGEFVRSRNIPTLRFPKNNPYQDTFHYAQERIKKLSPLV
jgi:hypothetical protein